MLCHTEVSIQKDEVMTGLKELLVSVMETNIYITLMKNMSSTSSICEMICKSPFFHKRPHVLTVTKCLLRTQGHQTIMYFPTALTSGQDSMREANTWSLIPGTQLKLLQQLGLCWL